MHRPLPHKVLAIVDPTGDLAFAEVEGEQLARLFGEPHTQILLNDEATAAALKKRRASYLHFSCHGFYRWDDPLQSGLILARGEPFTLAQVLGELKLDTCRLVALSACETGITEVRQSPDEYLGLPAGFLQAGAPAVLSTLWSVDDLSTMLLIERFYQRHLQAGEDFPSALRHAQRWLRSVTAGEPTQRPFAHPYYTGRRLPSRARRRCARRARHKPVVKIVDAVSLWQIFVERVTGDGAHAADRPRAIDSARQSVSRTAFNGHRKASGRHCARRTRKVAVETGMFRATGRDRNSPPVWATQTRCRRERREEKELETKPTRLIGLIRVIDATAFDEYRGRVGATVEKFGGVIRQRGAMAGFLWNEIDCGGFDAFVELEFPSRETAERWAASDDYRNLLPLRSRAMQLALFAVE